MALVRDRAKRIQAILQESADQRLIVFNSSFERLMCPKTDSDKAQQFLHDDFLLLRQAVGVYDHRIGVDELEEDILFTLNNRIAG